MVKKISYIVFRKTFRSYPSFRLLPVCPAFDGSKSSGCDYPENTFSILFSPF